MAILWWLTCKVKQASAVYKSAVTNEIKKGEENQSKESMWATETISLWFPILTNEGTFLHLIQSQSTKPKLLNTRFLLCSCCRRGNNAEAKLWRNRTRGSGVKGHGGTGRYETALWCVHSWKRQIRFEMLWTLFRWEITRLHEVFFTYDYILQYISQSLVSIH